MAPQRQQRRLGTLSLGGAGARQELAGLVLGRSPELFLHAEDPVRADKPTALQVPRADTPTALQVPRGSVAAEYKQGPPGWS